MMSDLLEYPVIGQRLYPAYDALPCKPGEHDFQLVPEEGFALLAGQRSRLVLYCPACGCAVVHSLTDDSPEESSS